MAGRFQRWRGLKALVHDAVDATTDLVSEGHESTARAVRRVTDEIEPLRQPVRWADGVRRVGADGILHTVKRVNRVVEAVTDVGLDVAEHNIEVNETTPVPMRSDTTDSAAWLGDAALGLVNAAVGDHLGARSNGLDLNMVFRANDTYVSLDQGSLTEALPEASPRIALFVHGLGTTEWCWCLQAAAYHGDAQTSFGTLLHRDLGFTPIYLRYNTGRRVSENGRELARQIEQLVSEYPTGIEDLTLIGHSMGGLVARSACHYALEEGLGWISTLRRIFCLGSPHQGAPLAKLGHVLPIETERHGGVMHHELQNHPAIYEQIRRACETD